MTDFHKISHADWSYAFEQGMRSASTFRRQSNLVIMGAVALFWANSKNISYLNSAIQYAQAYKGIRVEAVKAFLVNFTGAKYSSKDGKFLKAGKGKALADGFYKLESWVDWANENKPEPKFDAIKDEKSILATLERKLDAARDALKVVRDAEELDVDAEGMILAHIAKTEELYKAADSLYN